MVGIELQRRLDRPDSLDTDLSAWENEGGALASDCDHPPQTAFAAEEQQILCRLGASVALEWKSLPTRIQRRLFQHAMSNAARCDSVREKEQIARFLHGIANEGDVRRLLSAECSDVKRNEATEGGLVP
jgi:hypothetical protein